MALLDRFERLLDQLIPPPDEVVVAVRRGEALLAAGDADAGLRTADASLSEAPGFLRALLLRVDALAALGRPYDALAALDRAQSERALAPEVLARMVELAALVGDGPRCAELEAHVRARLRGARPEVARTLARAAATLLKRGDEAHGLRVARGATLVDPRCSEAWLGIGGEAAKRGDTVTGLRALERGRASLDPADAASNRLAGELASMLGDVPTAVRSFRRAWIAGDDGALSALVGALADAGDVQGMERVLLDAGGALGELARSLVAVQRGDPETAARDALAAVHGAAIPEALWGYAMKVCVAKAPEVAERWARESPDRPGARGVRTLSAGREALARDDLAGARRAAVAALEDPVVALAAEALVADAARRGWSLGLGRGLEELSAALRDLSVTSAGVETELRSTRRELDAPLRVVLLGEFSAGKSTFLNAMVGSEVSPMGVLPTTAEVHWLRYGEARARVIDREGSVIETSVSEAPRAAQRRRDEGVAIDLVEVTLPLPPLAKIELVDTPGSNAGNASHDAGLARALELGDVGLWLFDAGQAGKASELEPLRRARELGVPVMGVLNKSDRLTEGERDAVRALLDRELGELCPCVAAVSSRAALSAAREGSAPPPEWARWQRFLDVSIAQRREGWKRSRVARRALDRVAEAEASLALSRDDDRRRHEALDALEGDVETLREALSEVSSTVRREVSALLRDQLYALRDDRSTERVSVAEDTVAEVVWRARERGLGAVGQGLANLERSVLALGLVRPEALGLIRAPVVQHLERAASEGLRDALATLTSAGPSALSNAPANTAFFAGLGAVPSDPLAALGAALEAERSRATTTHRALAITLATARETLSAVRAPALEAVAFANADANLTPKV